MVSKASAKYIRISPVKVKGVISLIKGQKVKNADNLLALLNKKGAYYLRKVLKSAVAGAKNKGYQEENLFISRAIANPGPALKRWQAATFGRATLIRKRTSHILIELDAKNKILKEAKSK